MVAFACSSEYGGFDAVVEGRGGAVFEFPGFVYLGVHPEFVVPFVGVIGRCRCVAIKIGRAHV